MKASLNPLASAYKPSGRPSVSPVPSKPPTGDTPTPSPLSIPLSPFKVDAPASTFAPLVITSPNAQTNNLNSSGQTSNTPSLNGSGNAPTVVITTAENIPMSPTPVTPLKAEDKSNNADIKPIPLTIEIPNNTPMKTLTPSHSTEQLSASSSMENVNSAFSTIPPSPSAKAKKKYTPQEILALRNAPLTQSATEVLNLDLVKSSAENPKSPKATKIVQAVIKSPIKRDKLKPTKKAAPSGPVNPLIRGANAWNPFAKKAEGPDVKMKEIEGNVQSILNKMTYDTFDSLFGKLLNVGIDSAQVLQIIMNLIYDKATAEQHFSSLYAQLCKRLSSDCPSFPLPEDKKPMTFRRVLLNKCQEEFEKKVLNATPVDLSHIKDAMEKEEAEFKIKMKFLGNIKFIGELYKEGMLPAKIMTECIERLLKEGASPTATLQRKEECLESLCKLITTSGKHLEQSSKDDTILAKMNEYFKTMKDLSLQREALPSRIRFSMMGVIELRENDWVPRRKENQAKTVAEARAEAIEQQQNVVIDSSASLKKSSELKKSGSIPKSPSDTNLDQWEYKKGKPKVEESPKPFGRGVTRAKFQDTPIRQPKFKDEKGLSISSSAEHVAVHSSSFSGLAVEDVAPSKDTFEAPSTPTSATLPSNLSTSAPSTPLSGASIPLKSSLKDLSKSSSALKKEVNFQAPSKTEMTLKEFEAECENIFTEFIAAEELDEAEICLVDTKVPKFYPHFIYRLMLFALERSERDKASLVKLMRHFAKSDIIPPQGFVSGVEMLFKMLDEFELDIPSAPKTVAFLVAHTLNLDGALRFNHLESVLSPLIESGKAKVFLKHVMVILADIETPERAAHLFQKAQGNVTNYLPTSQRTASDLASQVVVLEQECKLPSGTFKVETSNSNVQGTTTAEGGKGVAPATLTEKLLALRNDEGVWNLSKKLATLLECDFTDLEEGMPVAIDMDNSNVWASTLVMLSLQKEHAKDAEPSKESQELIDELKAWLKDQCDELGVNFANIEKEAVSFLDMK